VNIHNKKSKVVLILLEPLRGILEEAMEELVRLARRAKGPEAVDHTSTRYGRHRSCPSEFVAHHMQRLPARATSIKGLQGPQSAWSTVGRLWARTLDKSII